MLISEKFACMCIDQQTAVKEYIYISMQVLLKLLLFRILIYKSDFYTIACTTAVSLEPNLCM